MSMVTLHCQAGDHEWERQSQRGRKPHSCPEHLSEQAVMSEQQSATQATISATERIDRLEMMLKSRGTHLSQVGSTR